MVTVRLPKLHKPTEVMIAIFAIILIVYLLSQIFGGLSQAGRTIADALKSDQTKAFLVALTVVAVVILALVFAKIDDPIVIFTLALGTGAIMFLALFYSDLGAGLGGIFPSLPPSEELVNKIKSEIYNTYADPSKNEVYFPGNSKLQSMALAAGYDLCASVGCLTKKDFVAVVFTDQILKIQEGIDDPKVVWNNVMWKHMYPLEVYLDGKNYIVYCKCDIREYDWKLVSTVCFGLTCYNLNSEYRHMPKEHALSILNNAPHF